MKEYTVQCIRAATNYLYYRLSTLFLIHRLIVWKKKKGAECPSQAGGHVLNYLFCETNSSKPQFIQFNSITKIN